MWVYNLRKLHQTPMSAAFLADTVDTSYTTSAILRCSVHCLDRHAQLTRCFSAVAELLVLHLRVNELVCWLLWISFIHGKRHWL